MEKWYVYKHYAPDVFVPLYWDDKILEFNSEEAAKDFIEIADKELGFDFKDVVIESIVHFNTEDGVLNATYLRVCAGDDHDFLYDISED